MHECPECRELCYCDLEDHDQPAPPICYHDCLEDDEADELDGFQVVELDEDLEA